MNKKSSIMKKEIRLISQYHSLIISKYVITFCLFICSYFIGYWDYAMSPVYIVLLLNVFPPLLVYIFSQNIHKNSNKFYHELIIDTPFILSSLKKKYHYSREQYIANSISFLFSLLLLILWQYNYLTWTEIDLRVLYLPSLIVIIGILVRFIGIIFYQIKLPHDLFHNNV